MTPLPAPIGSLTALLGIGRGARVAVVGAGGKTALIEHLADENQGAAVLVMPTTKIIMPARPNAALLVDEAALRAYADAPTPAPGITYAGTPCAGGRKLGAPSLALWAALAARADLTLMEADGSAGKPCKGWGPNEPVVPGFATHTVGVTTTTALGRPADSATVLRSAEFEALTGLAPGMPVTMEALAAMAAAPNGMFKGARGEVALFVNQAEGQKRLREAEALARLIQTRYPWFTGRLLAGSIRQGHWREL